MPGASTPNLGLTVPTVGGDNGIWGTELNGDLTILDALGIYSFGAFSLSGTLVFGIQPERIELNTGGAAGITRTLPVPATVVGRIATIKKVDSGVGQIIISTPAGAIDGNPNYTLFNQYQYVRLLSDGVNWNVIGGN